jgi:hypothetical protein
VAAGAAAGTSDPFDGGDGDGDDDFGAASRGAPAGSRGSQPARDGNAAAGSGATTPTAPRPPNLQQESPQDGGDSCVGRGGPKEEEEEENGAGPSSSAEDDDAVVAAVASASAAAIDSGLDEAVDEDAEAGDRPFFPCRTGESDEARHHRGGRRRSGTVADSNDRSSFGIPLVVFRRGPRNSEEEAAGKGVSPGGLLLVDIVPTRGDGDDSNHDRPATTAVSGAVSSYAALIKHVLESQRDDDDDDDRAAAAERVECLLRRLAAAAGTAEPRQPGEPPRLEFVADNGWFLLGQFPSPPSVAP